MQDVKFRLAVNGKLLRVDCGSKQDRVAETARLVIGIIEKNRLVERNIAVQRKVLFACCAFYCSNNVVAYTNLCIGSKACMLFAVIITNRAEQTD